MLANLTTFALVGLGALPVEAEVEVSTGLPKTVLVGLPEPAVRESIHRSKFSAGFALLGAFSTLASSVGGEGLKAGLPLLRVGLLL
jgi:hypothetical protein